MSKRYSEQFKDEAVALTLESDCPYSQIAKDLGVNYQTFGNWMRKAMSRKQSNPKKVAANKQDYKALERELKAARKELELRKKEISLIRFSSVLNALVALRSLLKL